MMKLGNLRRTAVLCVLCLLNASVPCETSSADEIDIGVIAPLSGGLADRGEEIVRTVRLFEEQCARSGKRHRYSFKIEDGKNGIGAAATTAAQKFINLDGIRFLITGTSGETIQAGILAQKAGVVTIAVLAVVPEVRELGDFVFRTYIDIGDGLRLIRDRMARQHGTFAVMSENAPFTLGMDRILKSISGPALVFSADFPPDETDFRMLVLRLKGSRPKAVYINCASPKTFIPLVRQLREYGVKEPLYSYFMPGEKQVREALGTAVEGAVFIDTPTVADSSPEFAEFRRDYLRRYPTGPKVEFLMRSTYDALRALIDSIERVGADPKSVRDQLYRLEFNGALGRVAFDRNGDVRDLNFVLKTIRNGEVLELKEDGRETILGDSLAASPP